MIQESTEETILSVPGADGGQKDKRRMKMIIAYNGTRFRGFQRQDSCKVEPTTITNKRRKIDADGRDVKIPWTIQECIEDALMKYLMLDRTELVPRFAGRTDAGVHARGQVFVCWMPSELVQSEATWFIRKSLNSRLPNDISVEHVAECHDDFDPRKDAKLKQYSYKIRFRRKVRSEGGAILPICTFGPSTFRHGLDPPDMWFCPWALDDSTLENYCDMLQGTHDYSLFINKKARQVGANIRTVSKVEPIVLIETEEEAPVVTLKLTFEAKGFGRSMVRNLTGFLVDLCRDKVEESVLPEIWKNEDDSFQQHIHAAPACGLCLEHVEY